MASPFFEHAGLLECSSPAEHICKLGCAEDLFGTRELGEPVFGGVLKRRATLASCSSFPASCSDVTSLDSENESSFCRQRSCATLKTDEDACTASGSPMAMLQCEDALDEDDCDDDITREWAPGRPHNVCFGPVYYHPDAEDTLRNELNKEAELGPFTMTPLPTEYREALVQWMRGVCGMRGLRPATFFTAVSVLDRYMRSMGEGATPPTLLQQVALTCVSVSAKCHQQQCAGELLTLARDENGNLYRGEDLRMMEIHVLEVLEWRLRTPTVFTFVTLFLYRVINRPQDGDVVPRDKEAVFRDLALRLAELAMLDHELTAVSYSTLAVACLLVAETEVKGGHMQANLKTVSSLRTVPGLPDLSNLSGPVQRLYCLYKSVAMSAPTA